jgi:hypothetical protein
MATTEVDRERGGDRTKRKQGGFRTMPFILGEHRAALQFVCMSISRLVLNNPGKTERAL